MPTFSDILSSILHPPSPNDILRDPMGQGQTLQGMAPPSYADALKQTIARMQSAAPPPDTSGAQSAAPPPDMTGAPQPVVPSAAVPGPLAALAPPPGKPRIKLKTGRQGPKPRIKLKTPPPASKPRIKLKALANV